MNRMEINIEKEFQTLKSEYNMFKEGLEKQETLNEKQRKLRKRSLILRRISRIPFT